MRVLRFTANSGSETATRLGGDPIFGVLEDDEKMQDMYHILNRSSVPLNEYEFNRVKYGDFCNIIDIFLSTNAQTRKKIATEFLRYAASNIDQSSFFVKIS